MLLLEIMLGMIEILGRRASQEFRKPISHDGQPLFLRLGASEPRELSPLDTVLPDPNRLSRNAEPSHSDQARRVAEKRTKSNEFRIGHPRSVVQAMAVLECDRPTIPFMKSRRRIAFPKAGTSLIRTRLQQGFAEGGMGSDRHFAWLLRTECLLWVKSGHRGWLMECPLYPQKRTLELSRVMSALCTLSELSIIENIAGHTARPLLRFAAVQFFKRVQHPTGLAPKGRFIATEAIERKIG